MPSNSHDAFEHAGYPWATPTDWIREEKIASDISANTNSRKSAREYTERPRPKPERKPFVEARPRFPREEERNAILEIRAWLKAREGGSRTVAPAPGAPEKTGNFQRFGVNTLEEVRAKMAGPQSCPRPAPAPRRSAPDKQNMVELADVLARCMGRIEGLTRDEIEARRRQILELSNA